jgi:hypothetical protein
MSDIINTRDPGNAGVGLVDVEAIGEKKIEDLVTISDAQQILNWIEERLREGNIIYASDLNQNPLFEERRDGSWKFHIVVQPLRGDKPDIGNESPK